MEKEEVATEAGQVEMTVGQKLHAARESLGKSLEDISAQTRVPLRMLAALERDAVSELPTGPYAMGFARSYAHAVGLDANSVASKVSAMIRPADTSSTFAFDQFEPVATNRVPSRALAWSAAVIALLMLIAYLVWKSVDQSPIGEPHAPSTVATTDAAPVAAPAPTPAVAISDNSPVRIAASERVWFSLEDAQGRSQFDLTLDGGEFYTLKPAQRALTLRTGRPQLLRILVGETRIPQLGADDALVSGVALDAQSLMRRVNAPTSATVVPAPPPPLP